MDNRAKHGIIKSIGLFSVPAPPVRFAADGGVFYWRRTAPRFRRTAKDLLYSRKRRFIKRLAVGLFSVADED
ncbi:MAG: hypothetical protein LLF97_13220 [Planctomycetaceae bacterium]|nr:hypothetical protein [Planctomycetaceae bacterium]